MSAVHYKQGSEVRQQKRQKGSQTLWSLALGKRKNEIYVKKE